MPRVCLLRRLRIAPDEISGELMCSESGDEDKIANMPVPEKHQSRSGGIDGEPKPP
jgi:hypothetical protein